MGLGLGHICKVGLACVTPVRSSVPGPTQKVGTSTYASAEVLEDDKFSGNLGFGGKVAVDLESKK